MNRFAHARRLSVITICSLFVFVGCSSVEELPDSPTEDIVASGDSVEPSDGQTDGQADSSDASDTSDTSDAGDVTPDACEGSEDGVACDDGNACTIGDTCVSGVCTGATNVVCSAETCEIATCDPEVGCVITYEPDGSECSVGCFGSATCQDGSCEVDPESAVDCPEPDEPCVSEFGCDPATGECSVVIPMPAGVECDLDENVCSLDSCDGEGQCIATGEMNTCDAQNDQSPCWTWGCNGKAGCVQISFVEGVSCNDNNPCTYSDICTISDLSQELCQGEPLPIDDQNPCTDDACSEGIVTHTPIDGLVCDIEDCDSPGTCDGGVCEAPESCLCDPVDGGWSEYTWGDCSNPCGAGTRVGTRTCTEPAPSCGGEECEGDSSIEEACIGEIVCGEFQTCTNGQCTGTCEPVNGGWSPWSAGACSAECGEGVSVHTRTCDSPPPSCGGADCVGESSDTVACNGATQCGAFEVCNGGQCEPSCDPVNGGWTDYVWGACDAECGGGSQVGTRTCTAPAPQCGGLDCQGDAQLVQSCNTQACINYLSDGVTSYTSGGQIVIGIVPQGVTSIQTYMWGGGGGGGFPGNGGGGAFVSANVAVTPGDEVELRVASGGIAHGAGGGASYFMVNGNSVVIAAGGGGAGSDGCSGCNQAIGGAGNGGGGGAVGGSGQAGTANDKYSTGSGGGGGASAGGPGAGGVSNDVSIYSGPDGGCAENGAPGSSHAGGGGHGSNTCAPGNNGASYQQSGAQSYPNGGGGGGGGGIYGGGGGAGKYTYSGGGGGGGASWTGPAASSVQSQGASFQSAGGTGNAYYQGSHGQGGAAGDHSNWPNNFWGPSGGQPGLVVIVL